MFCNACTSAAPRRTPRIRCCSAPQSPALPMETQAEPRSPLRAAARSAQSHVPPRRYTAAVAAAAQVRLCLPSNHSALASSGPRGSGACLENAMISSCRQPGLARSSLLHTWNSESIIGSSLLTIGSDIMLSNLGLASSRTSASIPSVVSISIFGWAIGPPRAPERRAHHRHRQRPLHRFCLPPELRQCAQVARKLCDPIRGEVVETSAQHP